MAGAEADGPEPARRVAARCGGYATAEWRKGKELEAGEATMAAVERCWKRPVMVRDVKGESVEMCRLQDLELKEDQAGQSGG